MTYTADYTLTVAGKWFATVRADDTPDTTIETREHDTFESAVDEAFGLVGDEDSVELGDIRAQ